MRLAIPVTPWIPEGPSNSYPQRPVCKIDKMQKRAPAAREIGLTKELHVLLKPGGLYEFQRNTQNVQDDCLVTPARRQTADDRQRPTTDDQRPPPCGGSRENRKNPLGGGASPAEIGFLSYVPGQAPQAVIAQDDRNPEHAMRHESRAPGCDLQEHEILL